MIHANRHTASRRTCAQHVAWLSRVALALIVLLQGCASFTPEFEEPSVSITSLELVESQGLAQRFRIGLLVTNPNAQALPITGMNYSLSLNGYDLIKGASNQLPTLAAYGETPITIEATTDLFAALRLLNSLANNPGQSLNYQFGANMDLEGWRPVVNINKRGVIELQ